MLYRVTTDQRRQAVDMRGLYAGTACWLAAPGPGLRDLPLQAIQQSRLSIAGINNVTGNTDADGVELLRPNIWFATDMPGRFVQGIWADPTILKILPVARTERLVPYSIDLACETPNTLFYDQHIHREFHDFLSAEDGFTWWRDTLESAIAILYWMGFRTIYCAGVTLDVPNPAKVYDIDAWTSDPKSTAHLKRAGTNRMHYHTTWNRLRMMRTTFRIAGLQIVSVTPESALNDLFPYQKAETVLKLLRRRFRNDGTRGLYDTEDGRKTPKTRVEITTTRAPGMNMGPSDVSAMRKKNDENLERLLGKMPEVKRRIQELRAAQDALEDDE